MNLRLLCLPAAAVLCAFALVRSAHAQLGAYGEVTVEQMSGLQNSPYATPGVAYNNSVDPLGFTGGVQYDVRTFGPVRLGADVRGAVLHTNRGAQANAQGPGAHTYFVLGGVRAVLHTRYDFLKPYAEGAVGLGRSNFGVLNNAANLAAPYPGVQLRNGVEFHAFVGADLHVLSFVDFRVVELGYGGLESSSHNFPLYSISSGFVFHIPRP